MKPNTTLGRMLRACLMLPIVGAATLMAACAGNPVPDWKLSARTSAESATKAWLTGNDRIASVEFDRARREVRASGQADALVRIELLQCALRVASLDFAPCDAAKPLLPDATEASRAYASYLDGRLSEADVALLPSAQQALARSPQVVTASQLADIEDPLSRLLGAGIAMRVGQSSPDIVSLAVDTASEQGWRRPLLAWLAVDKAAAEARGDQEAAARLQRRIDLVAPPAESLSSTPATTRPATSAAGG